MVIVKFIQLDFYKMDSHTCLINLFIHLRIATIINRTIP